MIREAFIPLVRCQTCESPLLQPVAVTGPIDGTSIVVRYCPDCEWRDIVVADDAAVQVWLRRDVRIASWMMDAADALATSLAPVQTSAGR